MSYRAQANIISSLLLLAVVVGLAVVFYYTTTGIIQQKGAEIRKQTAHETATLVMESIMSYPYSPGSVCFILHNVSRFPVSLTGLSLYLTDSVSGKTYMSPVGGSTCNFTIPAGGTCKFCTTVYGAPEGVYKVKITAERTIVYTGDKEVELSFKPVWLTYARDSTRNNVLYPSEMKGNISFSSTAPKIFYTNPNPSTVYSGALFYDYDLDGKPEFLYYANTLLKIFTAGSNIPEKSLDIGLGVRTSGYAFDIDYDGIREIIVQPSGSKDVFIIDFSLTNSTEIKRINAGFEVGAKYQEPVEMQKKVYVIEETNSADTEIASLVFSSGTINVSDTFSVYSSGDAHVGLTACDLDNDGEEELVIAVDANLYVKESSGVVYNYPLSTKFVPPAVCEDVDGDSYSEILIADQYTLYELNYDGTGIKQEANFDPQDSINGQYTYPQPLAVDVTGDGKEEILLPTFDGNVYLLDSSLNLLSSVPLFSGGNINTQPLAADLDGDNVLEFVVVESRSSSTPYEANIVILSFDGTNLTQEATYNIQNYHFVKSPVLAVDIDSDGFAEIVMIDMNTNIWVLDNS